jgi:hypothetical protein
LDVVPVQQLSGRRRKGAMRLRIGMMAVIVGVLLGSGMLSGLRGPGCATAEGKCERAKLAIPKQLVETEGGAPLKVKDGEHLVGTASLGGKKYQVKILVANGKQADVFVYSGGKRLKQVTEAPPPELQECLKKYRREALGPHGWYRWARDWFAVPEAEAAYGCNMEIYSFWAQHRHYTALIGCTCSGPIKCTVINMYEDAT